MDVIAAISNFIATAFLLLAAITILVLTPLALIPATRKYGAGGLFCVSWVFGAMLWVDSMIAVYDAWGIAAAIVALLIIGVGPVAMAFVIYLIHGMWDGLLALGLMLLFTFEPRFAAFYIAKRTDETPVTPEIS